ncbi:MAG: hypothetical protein LIP16_03255 [Clostridium sp.]|nr:hypothetical protein [Clostridium sp.]
MEIEYCIPNGKMMIDAGLFFRDAGMRQIRRMLKQLSQSRPGAGENLLKIRMYLQERILAERAKAVDFAGTYMDCSTKLSELRTRFDEMRSPCYAVYTEDKEVLSRMKELIGTCKTHVDDAKNRMIRAQKLMGRYEDILKDVEKIIKE